ncbi:SDO1-like protein [Phialemonium atrogriseum]|uniref:SDO1-like protein n=1 Tax=Phialemonium atrogriseum TaxID=1093897 RepID=A0AAJ0C3Y9_9PEZI|nr:SDO1-like protein [Phialemonium atrogriseum]KAK1769715.1 SDO1-like protein [Phialemonium atrogriseum]
MARGETTQTKVHFKGSNDDFVVFLESEEQYNKWQKDRSIPLAQVVSAFKIFTTNRQGAQGPYMGASQADLENEFGTHVDDDVIIQILEKGNIQQSQFPERQGHKNEAQHERVMNH